MKIWIAACAGAAALAFASAAQATPVLLVGIAQAEGTTTNITASTFIADNLAGDTDGATGAISASGLGAGTATVGSLTADFSYTGTALTIDLDASNVTHSLNSSNALSYLYIAATVVDLDPIDALAVTGSISGNNATTIGLPVSALDQQFYVDPNDAPFGLTTLVEDTLKVFGSGSGSTGAIASAFSATLFDTAFFDTKLAPRNPAGFTSSVTVALTPDPVPEAGSLALLGGGLLAGAFFVRRRKTA